MAVVDENKLCDNNNPDKESPQKLINLGLFNYWCDNPPQIYLDCVAKGHHGNGTVKDNSPRESIYLGYCECRICGYCYTVDSSD